MSSRKLKLIGCLVATCTIIGGSTVILSKYNSKISKDTSNSASLETERDSNTTSASSEDNTSPKVKSLQGIKNYNIHYGTDFSDSVIESMVNYDVVVVEPLNIRDSKVLKKIKDTGVRVYAYMSFAEVSAFDSEMLSKIDDSDYLLVNGEKVQNFGYNIGDIRKESFKTALMEVVKTRVIDNDYDGIFIDTLDDFEHTVLLGSDSMVDEMTNAGAALLKRLHEEYPTLSVILNRGFTTMDKCEERYVDAVLFEAMNATEKNDYYYNIVSKIDRFTAEGGVCLALSNDPAHEVAGKEEADAKGWVYYYRPNQKYGKWYQYLNS